MKILLAVLIALSAGAAHAQRQASPPWTELTIKSARLAETRQIFVSTPAGYEQSSQHFAVLVLLDANDREQFNAAIANTAFLASRAALPRLIVVGIPNGKDRTHDLTPTALGKNAERFTTAGGAGAFTDFIVGEVLPLVRSRYRAGAFTVLAGHSFGGLVALHAAATRDAFAGVVAMSPSLWWNDSTAMRGYADSVARVSRPLRLFVTSGEYEPAIAIPTRAFAARLDSIKQKGPVAFAYQHYGYANHGLTPLPSLMDGLRFVFDAVSTVGSPIALLGPNADSAAVMTAYLATRDSYAAGARALGMAGGLPEGDVNNLGYWALEVGNPRFAVWFFRQNVVGHPASPNVYDSLGDGLLAMGDTTAARAAFRQALDVAKRGKLPPDPATIGKLGALARRP